MSKKQGHEGIGHRGTEGRGREKRSSSGRMMRGRGYAVEVSALAHRTFSLLCVSVADSLRVPIGEKGLATEARREEGERRGVTGGRWEG
ncbi:MAG: hypothetical protein ACLQMF_06195 [Rectinemataceae bacterium]